MMKINTKNFGILALLAALVIGVVLISGCIKAPEGGSGTTTPPALSEKPDKATFQKYFSEIGLGRLPASGKLPADLQKNVTSFAVGDQIGLYGNIIEECQPRYVIYDVQAKKIIKEGGFPYPIKGGFAGAEVLDIPLGKYEYKVYVADVLVAIFPFEVR